MQRQSWVQEQLRRAFPEFNEKSKLIDYYVSFDFPEKQMKMVGWWQKVIEFIISLQPRTYLTYQELSAYVTVHNLKPTPLPAIINFLNKRDVLVPQNQMQLRVQAENQRLKAQQNKSWLSWVPFMGKNEKEKPAFSFTPGEKIFSKKAKELKKQQVRGMLPTLLPQHLQSIDEYKLMRLLEERCRLDQLSLQQLLRELQMEGVLILRQKGQKNFALYSPNPKDLANNDWAQLQSMKFCLREEIFKFEAMVSREEEKASKLRAKAGEQAAAMNKVGAKATLKQYLQRERKASAITTRKNVLQNQLTQLEYNQMNKSTLLLLQESQKVYQQTLIDAGRLEEAIDKNIEMAQNSRENNEKIEQLGQIGKQENDEQVDSMLEALTKEVYAEKKKAVQLQQVKVELREKEEAMDIEYNL